MAARAGVSIGAVYQYFPDKQAVLAAAARHELGDSSAAPAARRRALIEALIAMVGGLGAFGATPRASRPRPHAAALHPRHEPGWERRCADALDLLLILLV